MIQVLGELSLSGYGYLEGQASGIPEFHGTDPLGLIEVLKPCEIASALESFLNCTASRSPLNPRLH